MGNQMGAVLSDNEGKGQQISAQVKEFKSIAENDSRPGWEGLRQHGTHRSLQLLRTQFLEPSPGLLTCAPERSLCPPG